jgi:hypothetical protein
VPTLRRPAIAEQRDERETPMQQVKLFKGLESEISQLEGEVNAWIRQSGAKVLSLTGNVAPQTVKSGAASGGLGQGAYPPSDLVLILLYETADS